jgi:hypothetical protein
LTIWKHCATIFLDNKKTKSFWKGVRKMRPKFENREIVKSEIITSSLTPSEKKIFVEVCRKEKKSEAQVIRELLEEKINTQKLK